MEVCKFFAEGHHLKQQLAPCLHFENVNTVSAATAEQFCKIIDIAAQILSFDAGPNHTRSLPSLVVLQRVRTKAPLRRLYTAQLQRFEPRRRPQPWERSFRLAVSAWMKKSGRIQAENLE